MVRARSRQARYRGQCREGDRLRGDSQVRHRLDARHRRRRQGRACRRTAEGRTDRRLAERVSVDQLSASVQPVAGLSLILAVLASAFCIVTAAGLDADTVAVDPVQVASGRPASRTVAEFGSNRCHSCKQMKIVLTQLVEEHGDRVGVVDIDLFSPGRGMISRYRHPDDADADLLRCQGPGNRPSPRSDRHRRYSRKYGDRWERRGGNP